MTKENFRQTRPEKTERRAQVPQSQKLWEHKGHNIQYSKPYWLKKVKTKLKVRGNENKRKVNFWQKKILDKPDQRRLRGELNGHSVNSCESYMGTNNFKILRKIRQEVPTRVVTMVGLEEEQGQRQRREKDWQWESSSAAVSKAVRAQGLQHSRFWKFIYNL